MVAEIDTYRGNPVIKLMKDEFDTYPFSFGKKKALMIVEHFDEIKDFAYGGD